jgi:anti-sigma B factor antagonist
MEISTRPIENGIVMDVAARLVFGEPLADLLAAFEQELAKGPGRIVVNLADVAYIDSSGLETLVAARERCRSRGVDFCLLNPHPKARTALRITKLDSVLTICDDESTPAGA